MSGNKASRADTSGTGRDCTALSRRPEILDLHCLCAVARKHRIKLLEMLANLYGIYLWGTGKEGKLLRLCSREVLLDFVLVFLSV